VIPCSLGWTILDVTQKWFMKYLLNQRCAGHEILMLRGTRPMGLTSPPRLVPQMIFLNVPARASPRSFCTSSRPFLRRQALCPASPAPSNLRRAPPRPRTPEKFCIHHLIYFERFILHNWLTYYKKIWDKVQTWLFEWIAVDRTNMMSLAVHGLILVLLCDWDVTIPTDEGTSLDAPLRFQWSFAHRYYIVV